MVARFTVEEDAVIRIMYEQGKSFLQIADGRQHPLSHRLRAHSNPYYYLERSRNGVEGRYIFVRYSSYRQ